MGKDDPEKWISEILDVWNASGLTGKTLLILACIGASTTLTNLSGIIVEWKGLIAEMLFFYSQYVRDPIATAVRFVTLDYLRPFGPVIDAVLLYLIYFSAEKRVIGKLSERSALNSSMFIEFVIVFPLVFLSLALLVLYLVDRYLVSGVWTYAEIAAILVPLILIFLSFFAQIRYLIWLAKGNRPMGWRPKDQPVLYRWARRDFVNFATPMVFAFLVLALLASINSGLA